MGCNQSEENQKKQEMRESTQQDKEELCHNRLVREVQIQSPVISMRCKLSFVQLDADLL